MVKVKVYKDLMEILPSEIILKILVKLDMNDISSMCATNKKYKKLCDSNEDYMYTQLLKRDFVNLKPKARYNLYSTLKKQKPSLGSLFRSGRRLNVEFFDKHHHFGLLRDADDIGFKKLIKMGVDINATDCWGDTIIVYSLREAPENVNRILDMNPDLNGNDGYNVLFIALAHNSTPEIVNRILDMDVNVNVNVKNYKGWTTLMYALRYSTPEIVNRILDMNANVNVKNNDGLTPLMIAIQFSSTVPNRMIDIVNAGFTHCPGNNPSDI
jgi:ankyrin repeat protein